MATNNFDVLYDNMLRRLSATQTSIRRYIYDEIDWDDRLIMLKGPRGCGKTTLLLQHIKETFPDKNKVLYVSLDDLWFANHDIIDLVSYLYTHEVNHIFIDEVHYHPSWQQLIKNIYDNYPTMHIVYTGSSMLQMESSKADLSRRQIIYNMQGLSFREFLRFDSNLNLPTVGWEELLANHASIAENICADIKILPLFEKYLKQGYYPFYKEVKRGYYDRIREMASLIVEQDYPKLEDVSQMTIMKIKKMLMVLASRVPQTPKMTELYKELETDRNQGLKMLHVLSRGGLLSLLSSEVNSLKNLARPDKIYLDNPNMMYALVQNVDTGTLRETFFLNQVRQAHTVLYPKKGDFEVDGHYLFEVGGKGKTFDQIKDINNSFLAVDNTEIGRSNRIPLWMFGLLY